MESIGFDVYLALGILAIIMMAAVYSIYSVLTGHKSKNWNLEGTAKLDFVENLKYNIKNNKLFFMAYGVILVLYILWAYNLYIGAPFIALIIMLAVMYCVPPIRKKLCNQEIKLFDKGIYITGNGHLKWDNFKGYYKKGDYIYLVITDKILKIGWALKHNTEVENIIKTHLKEL
jgi:hypothetical protein